LVEATLQGELTKEQARRLYQFGPEAVALALLAAGKQAFAKKLRRLLRDGIRLRKRPHFAPGKFQGDVDRLNVRLARLAAEKYADRDGRRLAKRLGRYAEYIFTFLDYADVPFENNFAERQIRPAVILRKNSHSNRSERGAATQAILMSIYRTLKLRGLNPTKTIADALKTYVTTGQLPPLPDTDIADGWTLTLGLATAGRFAAGYADQRWFVVHRCSARGSAELWPRAAGALLVLLGRRIVSRSCCLRTIARVMADERAAAGTRDIGEGAISRTRKGPHEQADVAEVDHVVDLDIHPLVGGAPHIREGKYCPLDVVETGYAVRRQPGRRWSGAGLASNIAPVLSRAGRIVSRHDVQPITGHGADPVEARTDFKRGRRNDFTTGNEERIFLPEARGHRPADNIGNPAEKALPLA
jgi:hypothetical protein